MLNDLYLFGQEYGMYENDNKLVVYFNVDDIFTEEDIDVEINEPDGFIPGTMVISGQVHKKSETDSNRTFKKSFEFKMNLSDLKINDDIIPDSGEFEVLQKDKQFPNIPNKLYIYFDLVNKHNTKLKQVSMKNKACDNKVGSIEKLKIGKIGRKIENKKLTFED